MAMSACSGHQSSLTKETAERLLEQRVGSSANTMPPWPLTAPLTEDMAVSMAVRHDPTLLVKVSTIAAGRADVQQASVGPNPTLDIGIGVAIDGLAGAPLAAHGMQGLTWLWARPHLIAAAEAKLQATILDVADHALTLVASTRSSHATVVAAAASRELAIEDAASHRRLLEITQRLLDQGEATDADVESALSATLAAQRAALEAEDALNQAKITLLGHMGQPTASLDFAAAPSPPSGPTDEILLDGDGPLEALWARAMINRLDLAAAHARVDVALASRSLAELKRFPELAATVRYTRSFQDREAILPGAQLTLPLFDNGDAGVAKALASLETAVRTRSQVTQRVQSQVRSAMETWTIAFAQWQELMRQELDLADRQLQRVKAHMHAGESDDADLLGAEIARRGVQRQAIAMELKITVAAIELRRAVGGSWDVQPTIDSPFARSDIR